MVKCAVRSCKSRSSIHKKEHGINYHRVPVGLTRTKWIKNINLLRRETHWLPSRTTVICSKHFKQEDRYTSKKGYVILKKNAIPFIEESILPDIKMQEDQNIDTDEEMEEILESTKNFELIKTVKRLKLVMDRRLKVINNLRQKNKRLVMRNQKYLAVIKDLKKTIFAQNFKKAMELKNSRSAALMGQA